MAKLTSQPSAADTARNSRDLRVVLLGNDDAEQWRGQFSEWAIDNAEALTPKDIQDAADALNAGRIHKLNMGAGGVFTLIAERESPGPWRLDTSHGVYAILAADGSSVVELFGNSHARDGANARLIARAPELREANARLSKLAQQLASQLAECAGYIASVRTDCRARIDGEFFALQTLDWAQGAKEIAARANALLEQYDDAKADGEAATR